MQEPFRTVHKGDARRLLDVPDRHVDLVVTSPPYWRKRDYGFEDQIGQEKTSGEYVANIIDAMAEWRRVLRPRGSVFLNIGDTYWQKSLQGIPSLVEANARSAGWILRNRIIWVKRGGMPDPVQDRMTGRHEYIPHFAVNSYYMICLDMRNAIVSARREPIQGTFGRSRLSGARESTSRLFPVKLSNDPLRWLARTLYAVSVADRASGLWSARRNWIPLVLRRGEPWRSLRRRS